MLHYPHSSEKWRKLSAWGEWSQSRDEVQQLRWSIRTKRLVGGLWFQQLPSTSAYSSPRLPTKNARCDFKPADCRSLFVPTTVSVNMCQRWCLQDKTACRRRSRKHSFFLPLLRCFFLVLRHIPFTPRTGFMSLLLMGGGCSMGLGARVKHTGKPAAHIRIPVIPDAYIQRTHIDTQEWKKHYQWRNHVF